MTTPKPLAEIATIVDGPISGEVKATTEDAAGMIAEGEAIYALDPKHMVVKIPMTAEGLKAIKALSAKGIPHQLHPDFLRQPGPAGRPRRRNLCQPLPGPAGRYLPARHRADSEHS